MAREGLTYVLVPATLSLGLFIFGVWYLALVFLCLAGVMALFFRDPNRPTPTGDNIILAPADGRITRISPLVPGDDSPMLVSIFLSPLDVHINRAPIAGKITDRTYKKGKFLMATRKQASLVNEQNAITIQGAKVTVVCKQIAGVLARRIVCWKRAGDYLMLGERFGLIKFSSRTDTILPPEVQVVVREGARVRGGVTVIGRIRC